MKIILYVFSGTGNTFKIAELLKKAFITHEVIIYEVDNHFLKAPDPNEYELIGFGYPIHAFNTPKVFEQFIKSLPKVSNKQTFIFKTSGEPLTLNDGSSQRIIRILNKKGYLVNLEHHYLMPYNIMLRHSDQMVKQMWIYNQSLVMAYSMDILNNKKGRVKRSIFKRIIPFIFRIEWLYAKLAGPSFKVDSSRYINCNLCVNNCPMENITIINQKYKFHYHCSLCMRCNFKCPKKAISIGLLNNWLVNGDYPIDKIVNNEEISFPYIPNAKKRVKRIYEKYYLNADEVIKNHDLSIKKQEE